MTDTELQAALRAEGWAIMPHHGPGPRWGAVHGAGHVIGTICALRSGGYTVQVETDGLLLRLGVREARDVRQGWAVAHAATVRVLAGVV